MHWQLYNIPLSLYYKLRYLFLMFISHLGFLFCDLTIQVLCPFFKHFIFCILVHGVYQLLLNTNPLWYWYDKYFSLLYSLNHFSIDESGVLKSPTIFVLLSISSFMVISIYLIFRCSYVGFIYIYNCCIFFLDWPLIINYCPLSLVTVFILKSFCLI